jgi:ketosteroid isomerase-like protein
VLTRVSTTALAVFVTVGLSAAPGVAATASPRAAPQHAATPNASKGRQLVTKFLDLLKDQDLAGLRKFLSPAFQLQRADGSFANRAEYLKAPAVVKSHEIRNLRVTRAGDVIVTRYDLVIQSTVNGQPQSNEPAPRLSVFTKGKHGWQIVAHANFNVPAAEPQQ